MYFKKCACHSSVRAIVCGIINVKFLKIKGCAILSEVVSQHTDNMNMKTPKINARFLKTQEALLA